MWFASRSPPPKVPTDRVTRMHYFDDTIVFRTFVLYSLFVFDDVLDVQKLKAALEKVVRREGWNKLGGRVRRDKRGHLELHVPDEFTKERPAIGFTYVDETHHICADHPVASRIPKPPSGPHPAVVGNPGDAFPLVAGDGVPERLDDYLYTDQPALGLRVISFADKTVVSLNWLHSILDALASRRLLDAWALALQGREDEIPFPQAVEMDPLAELGLYPTEKHVLASQHMTASNLAKYGICNFLDLAWRSKENRVVCVPKMFIDKLRSQALAELTAAGETDPFVSEGDVLTAWFARLSACNISKDSNRTVAIQNAYSWRDSLEQDLLIPGRPYISNCVGFVVTLLPAKELLSKPLSHTARAIRNSIREQGGREQIKAYAALVRKDPKYKMIPMFGDSGMQLFMFSNWQKGRLYEADFAAAAADSRRGRPLTPSYVHNLQSPHNFSDGFIIPGRDAQGNYWIGGFRVKGLWAKMEKEMASQRF
ncbi:AAA ATPase [Apiospora arundinis]|uniref:AAA ATPase n=1 Tax=Apiospora arundinis TaxID=335852 RepID=A0ABR2J8V3_9PEZI